MGKRKRGQDGAESQVQSVSNGTSIHRISSTNAESTQIQIITGSYNKVLHGLVATVQRSPSSSHDESPTVEFGDNFLFNAHGSAIRCLALSYPSKDVHPTVTLASGGTDERINLYQISACTSERASSEDALPTLVGKSLAGKSSRNKELGSLLHHSSSVNALCFVKGKLLSGADDNTIAVTRARDWTMLSTMKAPIPKALGRPSGDTAPLGGTPSGISDFAVDHTGKAMISVSKGERCLRLWNLVTGKRAAVLNFARDTLRDVGEGKWAGGEGRRVVWKTSAAELAVVFEHGAVIYGMDLMPKYRVLPSPRTKVHQLKFLYSNDHDSGQPDYVVISTEDGRLLFFLFPDEKSSGQDGAQSHGGFPIPCARLVGQFGGATLGMRNRIKDFEVVHIKHRTDASVSRLIVTAGSDGVIRVWELDESKLLGSTDGDETGSPPSDKETQAPQVGKLIGMYETLNRITCMAAFTLLGSSGMKGDAEGTAELPKEAINKESTEVEQHDEDEFAGLDP